MRAFGGIDWASDHHDVALVNQDGALLAKARISDDLTGPLCRTAQNRIWLEIMQITPNLPAWMPRLALTSEGRHWEPRRLRLCLFTAARQLVTTCRR